jgi:drug/metabolite transporter (DMT)-like permease
MALLAGAITWGVIWYPYRILEAAGIAGGAATVLTYAVALLVALFLFRHRLRPVRVDGWLLAIAIVSAACNLGYVLATLHGEVMRVLLLFYLAPLWTVVFARFLLDERLNGTGAAIIALALAGAAVMLWRPELGAPWPRATAEWIGLAAGLSFALSNVLIRRADHYSIELKSTAVFAGVVLTGMPVVAWEGIPVAGEVPAGAWAIVVAVGLVLLAVNVVVQYGLTRVAAGRAVVILLFELVVAAVASWWWAGETMTLQEWLGGGLIVAASLFSARLEPPSPQEVQDR